ncbi:MAG: DUF2178 domain-containing protein [Clostridia bacterium]|nr:DUF2178 domain-containing protein [Clostridia bacterium]
MKFKPVNKKLLDFFPIAGALLVAASFAAKYLGASDAARGFMAGLGCAWVGVGAAGAIIQRLNPEYAKKMAILQKDERNVLIREKSGYITFLVTLFTLAILAFTFLMLDSDLACALTLAAMAVHVGSFFAAMLVYGKKL